MEQEKLMEEFSAYKAATFSDNTRKTYNVHLKTYLKFCNVMQVEPVPAQPAHFLSLYAAFLACRLRPSSFRQYMNIVRLYILKMDMKILAKKTGTFSQRLKVLMAPGSFSVMESSNYPDHPP